VERLKQARATGAETLVTACPKCMIHTTCAMRDPYKGESLAMEVRGLVNLLADQME
jgi:Fe-S oxidoreductase